jgi:hypothetical protein
MRQLSEPSMMRFRQVHLDFHTHADIPDIGEKFNAKTFAGSLKDAHVDSVTVFSKCHHGLSYHPTKVGRMHPHLKFDLLRAQVDALHDVGIKAPVYLTAGWDELAAFEHPEWRIVLPDNSFAMFRAPEGNGVGWAFLDLSTPYLDYLVAQTEEMLEMFPDADGIFMDISFQLHSISSSAKTKMGAMGLDWTNPEDRDIFTNDSVENYFVRIRDAVHKHDPKMPLFFNSGHVRRGLRSHYADFYSHLEVESLPTAGWGYEHFPLSARYIDPLGIPFLGMTGKFHTHWGEVGGYKHPQALIYEVGAMLAQGARVSIGDHLHPSGKLESSTLKLVAPAFKYIADRENWAVDTTNRADIAMLSVEAAERPKLVGVPQYYASPDEGCVRILLEAKYAFDVVDLESDFARYRLVILPDTVKVDAALKVKLDAYVKQGGKVLLTGMSGIDPSSGFVLDVGGVWEGTSPNTQGDYLLPIPTLQASFVEDPLFMYLPAQRVRATDGRVLGDVYEPYFDRTARHFMGHLHAPARPQPTGYAGGLEKSGYTYLSFPIFSCYQKDGAVAMIEIVERVIDFAMGGNRLITTSLPRAGRATVRRQDRWSRDIVHVMHATPALRGTERGSTVQPIQDLVPLYETRVSVATRGPVKSVRLVPSSDALPFAVANDRVDFVVPEFTGHQMIEISY